MRSSIVSILFLFTFSSFCQNIDKSGKKQGYWKKKDEKTNKLVYEGLFVNNQPVGMFKYYYPNDSVKALMNFRADGKTSYAQLFSMTGKRMAEGKYIGREVKDSTWTYYDEAGVLLSKETYFNGKKHGPAFVYFQDGKLSEERHFRNGLEDGPFKQYIDGVKLRSSGTYSNGLQEGKMVHYFPNGTEAAAGFYKNGLKTGPWIYKDASGAIKERELYKNGKLANKKETDAFFNKKGSGGKTANTPTTAPVNQKKGG
jgi:antitoxin component YwqK of YwqJK toxin-antitoxin module